MILVADASPLIFLAKIRRLELIRLLWAGDLWVPKSVASEVLAGCVAPIEIGLLEDFLQCCHVETIRRKRRFAVAMSQADNDALALALQVGAAILFCDDKLTRRMAEVEGVRPMGTLGVLLKAMQQQLITPAVARKLLDQLIEFHEFRISIPVYQAALRVIADAS